MLYQNLAGARAIRNYSQSKQKEPGGLCYKVAYQRIRSALSQTTGAALPSWRNDNDFCRLWGSILKPREAWLALPEKYRGKGAAGAIVWRGIGQPVDSDGVWNGALQPGAVLQTWSDPADYGRVKDGESPTSYGHSFIFVKYLWAGFSIRGIRIADQGYQSGKPLTRGDYGFWTAANLCTARDLPLARPGGTATA
jgi:hypothetical protein